MKNRFLALFDTSGWMLGIIGAAVMFFLAPSSLIAFARAAAAATMIAGLVIFGTRIFFPQVKLTDLVERASKGNVASAIVAAALMIFCGMSFLGVVWVMK